MGLVQAFSAWLCCQGHRHELVDAVKHMRNWQGVLAVRIRAEQTSYPYRQHFPRMRRLCARYLATSVQPSSSFPSLYSVSWGTMRMPCGTLRSRPSQISRIVLPTSRLLPALLCRLMHASFHKLHRPRTLVCSRQHHSQPSQPRSQRSHVHLSPHDAMSCQAVPQDASIEH